MRIIESSIDSIFRSLIPTAPPSVLPAALSWMDSGVSLVPGRQMTGDVGAAVGATDIVRQGRSPGMAGFNRNG